MNFTAKFNGQPPPTQDFDITYLDCDTGQPTTDIPTSITATPSAPWIKATVVNSAKVRVGVNQSGVGVSVQVGVVNVAIPDAETCEIGKVLPIPVTMTVKRGNVKFG